MFTKPLSGDIYTGMENKIFISQSKERLIQEAFITMLMDDNLIAI